MSKAPQMVGLGEIIADRYRLDSVLGKGAMGIAYKATQLALQQPVVVKLIRPEFASDEEYRSRFQREALTCSKLHHPNVVKIFDFGVDEGQVFLVMEYLKGKPLRDSLSDGTPLSWERAFSIATQINAVLVAAHAVPLVHRDLKPENVMLEPLSPGMERAVVVDFGLAFVPSEGGELGRLTASNVVLGTPQYLSPEQARGQEVGPPADVYSFGCILFELFTGRTPFVSKKVLEMVTDHVYKPPPSALQFAPELPPRVDALLQEMLRKRPEDRPNALELRIRLKELHDEGQAPPTREARAIEKRQRLDSPSLPPSQQPTQANKALGNALTTTIGVLSSLDRECEIALATKGIAVRPLSSWSDPLDGLAAVFAPEANASQVVQLAKGGPPVLAGTVAGDMSRIAELLRAGAADVVSLPVQADELLRKLARAMKRYQAQKKS